MHPSATLRRTAAACWLLFCLLCCLLCCLHRVAVSSKELSLDAEGRYENLVVAVDPNSPEKWALVEQLKAAVSNFAEQLSEATQPLIGAANRSLCVGKVFILVPRSWKNASQVDAAATWQHYGSAHVRLSNSQQQPHYTYQPGGCGDAARFINFDTQHVMKTDSRQVARQLLQNFARYRWGVFPEHGGTGGPHYYFRGGKLTPTTCSRNMKGVFRHNVTGKNCVLDANTNQLDEFCRFYPDPRQDTAASVMATTLVPSVRHFCSSSSEHKRHDAVAPNLHNRHCPGRSVSDVIAGHDDFADSQRRCQLQPPVQFIVVQQQQKRKLVIVLDVSGSMGGAPLLKMMSAVIMLLDDLEEGVICSIVTFHSTARVLKPPTLLDATERRNFKDAVRRLKANGGTAIGEGVMLAVGLLRGNSSGSPQDDASGFIALITDGRENSGRIRLNEAIRILSNTSVAVDTIAISNAADKKLQQLSGSTGGISCFSTANRNDTNSLADCIYAMLTGRSFSKEKPLQLFSSSVPSRFSLPVKFDSSAANGATFLLQTATAAGISARDLAVISPNATVYDRNSVSPDPQNPIYSRDNALGIVRIRLVGNVLTGTYTVTDSATPSPVGGLPAAASPASVIVTTKSSVDDPIVLNGFVSVGEVELNRETKIVVSASLEQGGQLLPGARIRAKVTSDRGEHADFWLRDDGVDPDAIANDGIHSGFVPLKNVTIVQEYSVRVLSQDPVDRVSNAGKFVVTRVDSGSLATVPPATARDLRTSLDLSSSSFLLKWTAVGDQQNEGVANHYELRAAVSTAILLRSFDSSANVSVAVTPQPSGSQQEVNVSSADLPPSNGTVFVALRAVGASGVVGSVSNVVSVMFRLPDNIDSIVNTTTITPEPKMTPTTTTTPRPQTTTGFAVAESPASAATVLVAVTLVAWLRLQQQ